MDKKNKNKINKKEKKLKEKEEIKEQKESKKEKDSENEEVLYQNLPKEELIELMERIEEENEEIKKEMEKYKEAAINLKDKFDHYQQIVEKEKQEIKKSTKEKIIKSFLKPFEKMSLSMNYKDDPQFVKAIEMVYKDFKNSFENSDLEFIIPEKGTAFDPFEHDVAEKIETDEIKEYHIHSTQNPGYKLGGKIIEPARVNVAVKPKKKVENKEENNNEENIKEGEE